MGSETSRLRNPVGGSSSRTGGGMGAEGSLMWIFPPGLLVILRSLFRHGNCHMRKLKDQAMAFEEKTSNCCLTKELNGFALEIAIGCGGL